MLRWKIGDVSVTGVLEVDMTFPPDELVPGLAPEILERHAAWLRPHFLNDSGDFTLVIQALVIEASGRKILVDTCVGNGRERSAVGVETLDGPFLEDLEAAGTPRESVDVVVCTHLHFDHVGWNTMKVDGRWVPTFPNAEYLIGREEYEFWSASESDLVDLEDTLAPVAEAGLQRLVSSDHRITDEVWLEPSPGHTPGHVSVRISSQGEDAVITGDLVHHPIQLAEPGLPGLADSDRDQARQTRVAFVERYGASPTLIIGTHFAAPTAGHLVRDGELWRFDG